MNGVSTKSIVQTVRMNDICLDVVRANRLNEWRLALRRLYKQAESMTLVSTSIVQTGRMSDVCVDVVCKNTPNEWRLLDGHGANRLIEWRFLDVLRANSQNEWRLPRRRLCKQAESTVFASTSIVQTGRMNDVCLEVVSANTPNEWRFHDVDRANSQNK